MALTIAVGFVVDDAIVVVENIFRHVEDGDDAVRGGACRRQRDRLHRPVDQRLADRRVHPAAADGRHHRPPVPRIRPHRDGVDRGVGVRVADARPDDGRALHAAPHSRARPRLPRVRERSSTPCLPAIGAPSTLRSPIRPVTLAVFFATLGAHRRHVRHDPEGLLPEPGHRPDLRPDGGRAGRLSRSK